MPPASTSAKVLEPDKMRIVVPWHASVWLFETQPAAVTVNAPAAVATQALVITPDDELLDDDESEPPPPQADKTAVTIEVEIKIESSFMGIQNKYS